MNNLTVKTDIIPAMSNEAIDKIRTLETEALKQPQIKMMINHVLHGGMYARTGMVPAGSLLTGALVKRATILIISGHMRLRVGDETVDVEGYHVFAASAHRKQAGLAITDTWVTMLFATEADSVAEAEIEGTDDADQLFSRKKDAINSFVVTGEKSCSA